MRRFSDISRRIKICLNRAVICGGRPQQYTFSPPGTTEEIEDYRVEFEEVAALELKIVPDISGGAARASLTQICLA